MEGGRGKREERIENRDWRFECLETGFFARENLSGSEDASVGSIILPIEHRKPGFWSEERIARLQRAGDSSRNLIFL